MSQLFSQRLNDWLGGHSDRTLGQLQNSFGQKSFAIAFLILMAIPALPLPTGGVSHVLEVINLLIALELIIGRRSLWLPAKFKQKKLGDIMTKRALPKFMKLIRWLEKFSRPRMAALLAHPLTLRLIGLMVFIYTLTAFLAPPFSGLDTLPALGVVFIALSLLLEDIYVLLGGLTIGLMGIVVEISLGSLVFRLFQ